MGARCNVARYASSVATLAMFESDAARARFCQLGAYMSKTNAIAVSDVERRRRCVRCSRDEAAELTGLSRPHGLASDSRRDLFVADSGHHRVAVYAAGSQGAPTFFDEPSKIATGIDSFNNGRIVAATNSGDCGSGGVTFFVDPAGGSPLSSIAISGRPVGIAVMPTEFPKQ